jgi:TRAP-type C4-dicarboxylate transport system permease small subunit
MKSKNWLLPVETGITSLNKWLSIGAAIFGGLIMIIATVDVITAKVFDTSVPSGKQLIEEFNVLLVFLAIAYVTHARGHIRITLLERWMSAGVARAFRLFGHVVGALCIGFCAWRAVALLSESLAQHAQKYGAINFPLWPFQTALLLGLALLSITFIMLFVKEIKTS